MLMVKIIREPTSLLEAEMEYIRQVIKAGYVITGPIQSHWQPHLFRETHDAVITSNIEKES
jgi:hypothetical protein